MMKSKFDNPSVPPGRSFRAKSDPGPAMLPATGDLVQKRSVRSSEEILMARLLRVGNEYATKLHDNSGVLCRYATTGPVF
jgi:hypothetical protein